MFIGRMKASPLSQRECACVTSLISCLKTFSLYQSHKDSLEKKTIFIAFFSNTYRFGIHSIFIVVSVSLLLLLLLLLNDPLQVDLPSSVEVTAV